MSTHIKDIINSFLKDKKEEIKKREKIEKIINKTLDKNLKRHISLARIYKNKIIFYSDSSVFSYDLKLKKEDLLKKIRKEFPGIEDIKVKIG